MKLHINDKMLFGVIEQRKHYCMVTFSDRKLEEKD